MTSGRDAEPTATALDVEEFAQATTPTLDLPDVARGAASSVVLNHVTKRFGDVAALSDLSLEARAGEFLVLLGPSGCGKSTVLRLVAGLETPTTGDIRIGERDVNRLVTKDRDVAMVFQSYALYPHLNVRKNIEFPLRSRGVSHQEIDRIVPEVARSLQLDKLLHRKPAELSGGQRQRVALARALVRRPRVFLMDEPLSNLDAQLRVEMRAELVELHATLGITILYVTHDQIEAMTMGQRIAVLKDGLLQQLDAPDVVRDRPANAFVASFVGSPPMNVLNGEVHAEAGSTFVQVAGGAITLPAAAAHLLARQHLDRVIVGVRPEDFSPSPDGPLRATVSLTESLGRIEHVTCRLEDGRLVNVQGRHDGAVTGDAVRLAVTGPIHLFHPDTGLRLGD